MICGERSSLTPCFNPHAREGATPFGHHAVGGVFAVSIHTPVRARRCKYRAQLTSACCFNPHAREGATSKVLNMFLSVSSFNPHAREGATFHQSPTLKVIAMFQSTRP